MPSRPTMNTSRIRSPSPTSCAVIGSLRLMEESAKHLQGEVPPSITLQYGSYTIGRGSHSDIHIKAQMDGKFIISRTHALLQVDKRGVVIKDLESTNGVFVNEKRIHECELNDGDIVRFAGMSEVPVGTYLTCTNASVVYKVFLNDAPAKGKPPQQQQHQEAGERGEEEKEEDNEAAVAPATAAATTDVVVVEKEEETHYPSGQATSNGHSTRPGVPILAISTPDLVSSSDQSFPAKRARIEPEGKIRHPPALPMQSDILCEILALKDMHARQLAEIHSKVDSLQQALLLTHQNGVTPPPTVSAAQATPNSLPPQRPAEKARNGGVDTAALKGPEGGPSVLSPPAPLQLQPQSQQLSGVKQCVIEASSLRSLLTCALCHELLCLPVVLRCSHGYCWHCIEKSIRREGASYLCPVCCDPLPPTSSSSSSPPAQLYYRSDHLDSIVWLILEAGESKAMEAFENRTKEHRKGLAAMGIDSTRPYDYAEGMHTGAEQVEREGARALEGQAQREAVTCDYCGSTLGDHGPDACPHRMHEDSESEPTLDGREEDL